MRRRYCGFGLNIASDFAIPGAVEIAGGSAPPDLAIDLATTGLGPAAEDFPPYRRLGSQLELIVPGIARYLLASADRLLVHPEPDVDTHAVSALLIASGIPMALWARGGLVLHASGVMPVDSATAVAIVGASGSGKSALASALVEGGGRLVGDDSLWLREQGGGTITASGLPGGIFAPDTGQRERAFWPTSSSAQADAASLAAIIVLDPDQPAGPPQRLTGTAALTAVLRHRHRPRIPALLGIEADRLDLAVLLCGAVPVYALGNAPGALADRLNHIRGLALAKPQPRSA